MSARQYLAELDNGQLTTEDKLSLTLDYIASNGQDRDFCGYARLRVAEQPRRQVRYETQQERFGGAHPDSFPPGWQQR